MASPSRNYAAEYKRRIARGAAKGLTRSQARGHPKPLEAPIRASKSLARLGEKLFQTGLTVLRQERNLRKAAKATRVSPELFKRIAVQRGAIEKRGRRWVINPKLPRRMPLYSRGRSRAIVVGDLEAASLVGRYM